MAMRNFPDGHGRHGVIEALPARQQRARLFQWILGGRRHARSGQTSDQTDRSRRIFQTATAATEGSRHFRTGSAADCFYT
jgi:hypothetical protein